ncbi:hypothetical protein PAXRUDRAFT_18158 [Paxillus rubicundulus Ve08.2h10]|uniref:Unplaced genomic scaffold scaffold_2623, whole genome shotgun sequence n=1 Tax=Paxillus rubicundulus Ve08.2h10 TaxID=930991 RepID=A0A0D0CMK8_9AGAM|nr:hypothetical protein PAXRUDRAFT_18158 [Paxillus rubicundulus Ve08.2h10]
MSATKCATLAFVHVIFKGLQEDLKEHLANLPDSIPTHICEALVKAHQKLSDYFYKFDDLSLYVWAAILDPHINYTAIWNEASDDADQQDHLRRCLDRLHAHFKLGYVLLETQAVSLPPPTPGPIMIPRLSESPWKDFALQMKWSLNKSPSSELDEYLRMPQEPWEGCDPVTWWAAHWAQFPTLAMLAHDVLTVPGCSVTVERVFSGGRDTISLRRASLKPGTIRMLMLLKQWL